MCAHGHTHLQLPSHTRVHHAAAGTHTPLTTQAHTTQAHTAVTHVSVGNRTHTQFSHGRLGSSTSFSGNQADAVPAHSPAVTAAGTEIGRTQSGQALAGH